MTLTASHYDQTITITQKGDDLDIDAFVELCRQMALAMGYHPDSVAKGFNDSEGDEKK